MWNVLWIKIGKDSFQGSRKFLSEGSNRGHVIVPHYGTMDVDDELDTLGRIKEFQFLKEPFRN